MIPLPIDPFLPEIVSSLRAHSNLVLVAEPGAGKTTRIPPAIIKAGLLRAENPNLVMLQPRRVAARAAAARIAEENNWSLGREVGYHVRFDRRMTDATRLRVLTEGILTRQLIDDPFLESIGTVILDEFHERSIHSDIAIALLREIQQTVRPDLKLIVMSATIEAEPVAKFLGDCPVIRVPGRTFPVQVEYSQPSADDLEFRVSRAVRSMLDSSGDILVFLPGAQEIRRAQHALTDIDAAVLPLHGSLPPDQQDAVLRPGAERKIILSTNIAETSLTIPGVRNVIDSGLARVPHYDPQRGLDRLDVQRISKASATQRAGRAGRTAPGKCLRLWTAKEDALLTDFDLPEIQRIDLAPIILSLHAWGRPDVRGFNFFEPPSEETILAAEKLLMMLGAISPTTHQITPLGKMMVALPVHPRLARLLLAADSQGLSRNAATMAALLSEKDILGPARDRPPVQGASDLLYRMDLIHRHDRTIDPVALRTVHQVRDELLRYTTGKSQPANENDLLKLLLLAYPDRVARRRENDPMTGTAVGGGGVRLAAESVVRQGEFFLALDARRDDRSANREALVRLASRIEENWLEELFPQFITRDRILIYDPQRERVVARGTTKFLDLIIDEDQDAPVDPQRAGDVLARALAPQARELFEKDESAANLLARIDLLRRHMPEHPWPKFDDNELADTLITAAAGKRSKSDLTTGPLVSALMERLPYPLDRQLKEHAPDSIEVPTGNHIRIEYLPAQPPRLSVRLQEMFGLLETPRIAAGRVPLVLHLLSPGYKPVQVTQDLRSFWTNTYPQVRKDLRARYPKHSWPDDPFSAKPVAKGKPRR